MTVKPTLSTTDSRALAAVSTTVLAWASAFVAIRWVGESCRRAWRRRAGQMSAGKLAVTTYLAPPLAALLAWMLLSEVPPPLAFSGGVICLFGVALSRRR